MSEPSMPVASDTLVEAACKILQTGNPWKKAEYGEMAANLWKSRSMSNAYVHSARPTESVPAHPSRDDTVKIVPARDIGKRGKGGSLASRQALLHSLVHIESWAVDLSWDIIARFGAAEEMPEEFFDDFVRMAEDEGRHFKLLEERLTSTGSHYGAFDGHEGLWESAKETSKSLKARLAIEHCVHEARGLDIIPQTISRFRSNGDSITAGILETVIYPEEITHCAAGVKWFRFLCLREMAASIPPPLTANSEEISTDTEVGEQAGTSASSSKGSCTSLCQASRWEKEDYVISEFHQTVRKHFHGRLKPPFNEEARSKAGFGTQWYLPLSVGSKP